MHRVPISEILICGTRSSGILQDSPHLSVDITHVAAHREGQALSALEEWCFLHNQLADRTAVRANYQRTSQFWTFYHRHVAQVQAAQTITSWVQFVLLTVSQFVLQRPPVPEPKEHRDATLPDPSGLWTGLISFHRLPAAAARYGQNMVRLLMSWFFQTVQSCQSPVVWVSQIQLYLDFQLTTGSVGPVKAPGWTDGDLLPLIGLAAHPFRTRVRWFSKAFKETLRHCSQPFCHRYGLPDSEALLLHTGVIAIPWPVERLRAIDRWLLKHLPLGVRRTSTALDSLPLATRDWSLDGIFLTSALF